MEKGARRATARAGATAAGGARARAPTGARARAGVKTKIPPNNNNTFRVSVGWRGGHLILGGRDYWHVTQLPEMASIAMYCTVTLIFGDSGPSMLPFDIIAVGVSD